MTKRVLFTMLALPVPVKPFCMTNVASLMFSPNLLSIVFDKSDFLTQRNTDLSQLIESGSNANGEWARFADGTQVCWIRTVAANVAISNPYGNILFTGSRSWTFPRPFAGNTVPVVICSQFRWGTGGSWGNVTSVSFTNAELIGMDSISRAAGTNVNIAAMAIGRWQ